MNQNSPIGIFDSGIGGVTVLKEIVKILPKEKYIYYSDSKNNPYGDKSDIEIKEICNKIVEFFIEKDCKAIVIACNTASAKAASYLRNKYKNLLFIAIEPAYKMVYDYAYDEPTLVMATKGTIESEKFQQLYKKCNNNKTKRIKAVGLAELIEEGKKDEIKKYLQKHIGMYKGKIKDVVLGCTHYPLIQKDIQKILGDVRFFNGAPYVAKNLKNMLYERNLLSNNKDIIKIDFIDSSNSKEKEKRFFNIMEN